MASPNTRLITRTRLSGHPGLRNNTPSWAGSPSFPTSSLRHLSLSPDIVSESDVPPDIWSLLEDLDSCLYDKELDLDAAVQLVENALGITLSSISKLMSPLDPSGAQLSATDTSNNSLEVSIEYVSFINNRRGNDSHVIPRQQH
jgi:hypothetical protein